MIGAVILSSAWAQDSAPAARGPKSAEPCEGVRVQPGMEVQDLVAAHSPGTTYCFAPGLYRLTKTIVPKAGDKLIGSAGVVLNGAKLITNWKPQGKLWMATGQTQRSPVSWNPKWPEIGDPTAQYNEDVFIDDRPLRRVLSLAEVGAGKFFFDYDNAVIYIGDDPAGHRVECGATEAAIEARAADVVVKGLTIEKFTLRGISVSPAALIENNEVRYVHGAGIRFGTRCKVLNNYVHHNGKYGMNGGGEDALLEGNELSFNNAAAYRTKRGGGCWDAGATKFALSTRLVVRNNYSHNNYCDGFWSDTDNIGTVYEGNRIENNYRFGIVVEISYATTIRNNKIRGNMASGIFILASSDQDIHHNAIENNGLGNPDNGVLIPEAHRGGIMLVQQKRGSGRHGEYLAKNISVHDNTFVITAGAIGATKALGNPQVFSQNNVFAGNHYFVPDPNGAWWSWESGIRTWPQWRAAGHDAEGTLERIQK